MFTSILLLTAFTAAPLNGTLTGQITDSNGRPISDARIDIWTARPKVGLGTK